MTPEELGGIRSYISDFEIYDENQSGTCDRGPDLCEVLGPVFDEVIGIYEPC